MSEKALKKHCEIAWELAVYNCKLIIDGLVDIIQQKLFISSFQNAIELCFKQILIDENEYNVIDYGKMESNDARLYLTSLSINDYISTLDSNKKSKLFTIEFKKLIDIFSNRIKDEKQKDFSNEFSILKDLRNNETHFYININDYLTFNDFKKMCVLLEFLYNYFKEKDVIKHVKIDKPRVDENVNLSIFKFDDYIFKSYNYFIKNSQTNKMILDNLPKFDSNNIDEGIHVSLRDDNDTYGIAYELFNYKESDDGVELNLRMNFNEFYRRFTILKDHNLIICKELIDEPEWDIIDKEPCLTGGYFALVVTRK